MNFRPPSYDAAPAAAVGSAATPSYLVIIGIVTIVAMALGIGAIGIGLGVGFGVGLKNSKVTSSKLSAPTINCDPSAVCGCSVTPPSFSPRIINGDPAVANSWPWMVYLTMGNNAKICSGFLISQRHVLTAASCVTQYGYNITVNLGFNSFQSSFGGINITNTTTLATIGYGDIAVVTLGFNITYTTTIKPCCITSNVLVPVSDAHGVIAGWGETSITTVGTVSPILRQAVVQVRNTTLCGTQSSNDTLCASYDSISACPIDSGGPLMVVNNNAWTCVGIITAKTGCNNPILFTRIAAYASLIVNVTGIPF